MPEYNPSALYQAYQQMEAGDAKMRAIRTACAEAEQHNDNESAVYFHYALVRESVFSGDRYQALIDFPQLLKLSESDPELSKKWEHDILWAFKWILEAASEFYQIERIQILRWYADYRRRLVEQGYTLRSFYEKRGNFYYYADRAKLRLDYEDFQLQKRDRMSDSRSDEYDSMVEWELSFGERELAKKHAQIIFDEGWRTEETPATTYGYLLVDAMAHGEQEAAADYAAKLRPLCAGKRFRLEEIGKLLCYDGWQDVEHGVSWLQKHQKLRDGSKNPFLCFWYDRGAAMLMARAAERGLSALNMQPDALMAESKNRREAAEKLGALFDARNGSDFFAEHLAEFDALV